MYTKLGLYQNIILILQNEVKTKKQLLRKEELFFYLTLTASMPLNKKQKVFSYFLYNLHIFYIK